MSGNTNESIPERIGDYEILCKLKAGGMGVVYKAKQSGLNRAVALKMMLPKIAEHDDSRRRFIREAQAMAAVSSDYIVQIFDIRQFNQQPYFVMEFLEGETLEDHLLRVQSLEYASSLRIGMEIALGLSDAHRVRLIHRDLKPDNLFLKSPNQRVKILDFGLARPVETTDKPITQGPAVMGTPGYMSPEQGRGDPVDERADIYSFGVILYRLLTNRLPIPAPSINSYLMSLGGTIPPPAIQWNPSLPLGLSQLIEWMLQKEPERRPRNIDSVIQELKRFEMLTPSSVTPAKTAVEKPRGTLPPSNPAPPPDLEPKRDTPPSNATPPTPAKPSPAISTTCPKCRTIFNLSRDLFGKPMRCPNSDCREIFLVSETPPRAEKVSKKKPANQSKPVVQEDEDEDFPIVTTRPKSKQKTPAQKIQPSPRRFDDDDDPQSYRRKTASSKMSMIIFGGIGALITIIATIVALLNLFR